MNYLLGKWNANEYQGEKLNIKEIYARNKKRRGRSKYLLSIDVMVGKENPIPAKIVCVRNKANRKDWLAFLCTNPDLSEEEIIRIYGKRWQIIPISALSALCRYFFNADFLDICCNNEFYCSKYRY